MNITNLNPDADIGASAWLVELDEHRILLDAGMHPKREGRDALPRFGKAGTHDVDAIAISHCHHDHLGALPVAVRHFPKAHVLMTELSYILSERVLHNSVNVMTRQRDELGIREYPLYTHDELDDIAPRFQGFKYNREVEWAAFHKTRAGQSSPTLEFFDAGHTLGSAGILLRGKKETLFYTGDVCLHDQTILKSARFEDVKADVMIMETTRGNREVPKEFSREGEIGRLVAAIHAAQKKGLRDDSGVRAGADAGNARAAGAADARGEIEEAAHLHRRPGPRVHGDLRHRGAPHAPAAHEFEAERGGAVDRAGKRRGGEHEVERRENFRHHRGHDERKHGGARSGQADDRRRAAEHFFCGLRGPGFAGGKIKGGEAGRDVRVQPQRRARD